MSICIIGGNERMERQYVNICKKHNCKAKVFTRMKGNLKDQIGSPDLIVLFTNTVCHKMVKCALAEAERCNANVISHMHQAALLNMDCVRILPHCNQSL